MALVLGIGGDGLALAGAAKGFAMGSGLWRRLRRGFELLKVG